MGGTNGVMFFLTINRDVRVLVSCVYENDPVMANYAVCGFKGIVEKPYTRSTLLAVVNQVLGE